jgi:uncharacterized membrane protein
MSMSPADDGPTTNGPSAGVDPMLAGFDHLVALAGYALLFLSVFMAGVPALATFVLALAHRRDAHPVARSHFRFQLRIFYTAILFIGLAAGSLITAGGLALTRVVSFVHDHLPGLADVTAGGGPGGWSVMLAGVLTAAALLLFVLAAIWLMGASAFGFLRLLAGKPIGHHLEA